MAGPGRRIRVYVDTSVIGGCLDDEFRGPSVRLFDRGRAGGALLVISDTTLAELASAPPKVRDRLSQDMEHMPPEERVRYIRSRAASTALGRSMAEGEEDAAQPDEAADRPAAGRRSPIR